MEDNSYVNVSAFMECQELDIKNDDEGDNKLYVGTMYAPSGTRTKIVIFSDEECSDDHKEPDVESNLKKDAGYNLKLSYQLLKRKPCVIWIAPQQFD